MGYSPQIGRDTRGEDHRFLGSRHGLSSAKSYLLDASKFPANKFPRGIVPAGQTLAVVAGKAVPYAAAGSDGSQNFKGVLAYSRDISQGDELAPVIWHGLINSDHLPTSSEVPSESGQITFN